MVDIRNAGIVYIYTCRDSSECLPGDGEESSCGKGGKERREWKEDGEDGGCDLEEGDWRVMLMASSDERTIWWNQRRSIAPMMHRK